LGFVVSFFSFFSLIFHWVGANVVVVVLVAIAGKLVYGGETEST